MRSQLRLGVLLLLTACTTATPVTQLPAPPPDPNFQTLDLPAARSGDNFLLTAEGESFLDDAVQKLADIVTTQDNQTFTTHLVMRWQKRFNPSNKVRTYGLTVTLEGNADASHTFSENIPTAFVEIDGKTLPNGTQADLKKGAYVYIQNARTDSPPHLDLTFSPSAAQAIRNAKKLSLKVQLKSDRLSRSSSCVSPTNSVDDFAKCQFAYTGRTLTTGELSRLKLLFQD